MEQHWSLCKAIWTTKGMNDVMRLVEFQTTLQDRALQWYMKFGHCPQNGVAPTLGTVKQYFVTEFQQPKFEQQSIAELKEIPKITGEVVWKYR